MSIIISGFPGVGKTTLQKSHSNVIDLESYDFKWLQQYKSTDTSCKEQMEGAHNRIYNRLWPLNYVKEIIKKTSEYDIVLISQEHEMLNCLKENGINYIVCFPMKQCKDEYIKRYINREDDADFLSLVNVNYDVWIDELMNEENKIIIGPQEFLSDALYRFNILQKVPKNIESCICKSYLIAKE